MKLLYIIFFTFIISSTVTASPLKPLNAVIKGNNVCIYTNNKKSSPADGRIYLYMGDVYPGINYKSSYSKLYTNIKTPIDQVDCIGIDASHFKSNTPYDITLDMQPIFSTRICLDKDVKPFVIKKVIYGFECVSEESNKNEKGFFQRLFDM